ncbi:universal stress protein [Rhodopirellula sp. JC639]|uniref:universal stress protein n=1 Tax=Stieleria mannarensis TaxID=2755585 RepID=UPI0016033395|nr:universal stress protein [Rhodopirellula sp. JC639]
MERFKKLLVYTGTEEPESAIARAVVLAMENGASLTLMDVIKPIPKILRLFKGDATPDELQRLLIDDHRAKLQDLVSEFDESEVNIDIVVTVGDPAMEVIREVMRNEHDLVIKAADGFRGAGRVVGSVARALLRMCPCAMLLLKPQVHGDFDQVLAAIDVDRQDTPHKKLNEAIADLSLEIARSDDATLHWVSAWEMPLEVPFELPLESPLQPSIAEGQMDDVFSIHAENIRTHLGELWGAAGVTDVSPEIHVRRGPAAEMISEMVEEVQADLLVMGTVCRTGIAGLLIGNTAESVLAGVSCSVLALKPPGFVCPVGGEIVESHVAT